MKIKYSLLFILVIIQFTALKPFAQTAVVAPSTKAILFKGGIAHLGNGRVIENSLIGIKDGKIILITDAATARIDGSVFDERITITGKHVYPGIIAPSSTIGLNELDAVRATNDFSEVGYINPHVRSLISYNTDSKIIPTIRTNGILLVQASPRGGLISGSSSIMKLDGWNWEDAVLKADDGIHLNWPEMNAPKRIRETDQSYNERVKNYNTSISNVTNFFADAKAYSQIAHDEKNIRFEAMKGIITGEKILYVHTNSLKDIIEVIAFTKKFEIKKYVLVGARDAYLATAILKENNVPVILARVHELPEKMDDDVDLPYKRAAELFKAGVLVCLTNEGDMEAMGTRNLPFQAGTTVAYGLTKEEALMLITSNTAKILGIEDRVGVLEENKQATFFISEGDALDMISNNVVKAFIDGKEVELPNEQLQLYNKYKQKYGLK